MESNQEPDLATQLQALSVVSGKLAPVIEATVSDQGLLIMAQAMTIVDKQSADTAIEWRNKWLDEVDKIKADAQELRTLSDRLHKGICRKIAEACEPYLEPIAVVNQKWLTYDRAEKERIRLDNERKGAEEREQERQRRDRELHERTSKLREDGLIAVGEGNVWSITEAGVSALDNHDMYPPGSMDREILLPLLGSYQRLQAAREAQKTQPTVTLPPSGVSHAQLAQESVHRAPIQTSAPAQTKPSYAGGGTRENWDFETLSLLELVQAAAKNPEAYLGLLEVNETAARARARTEKGNMRVPGLRAFDKGSVTRAKR